MRKFGLGALALTLVLALASVAYAVTNTYSVTGKVSPSKAGSKKKPVPVGIKFNYTVDEQDGLQPAPIKKYAIAFAGLRVNHKAAPLCKGNDQAIKDGKCKTAKKGVVGTGTVTNLTGKTGTSRANSVPCVLDMKILNTGKNKAALWLKGAPPTCVITINEVIRAKFVKKGGGTAMVFDVPMFLLHPAGLDNSVMEVKSSIKKISKKIGGKKVGYYESIGGCKKNKRAITVTFTDETNASKVAKAAAACKK